MEIQEFTTIYTKTMNIPRPKYKNGETFIINGNKYLILDYQMVTKKLVVSEDFSHYIIKDLQTQKVYQMPWSKIQNAESRYAGTLGYE